MNACVSHVCLRCRYHVNIKYNHLAGKKKRKEEKSNSIYACTAKHTHKQMFCVGPRSLCGGITLSSYNYWVVCPRSQIKQTYKKKTNTLFTIKAWITARARLRCDRVRRQVDVYEEEYTLFMLTILEYIDRCETCASWKVCVLYSKVARLSSRTISGNCMLY